MTYNQGNRRARSPLFLSQLIRQLELGMVTAGRYLTSGRSAYWNGETDKGEVAANGIYFYQLQAGNYIKTRKMVILK